MGDWGERAEAWSAHWTRLSEPARAAVADAAGIGAGTRVLDAGCGTGEFCAQALALGARVSGIDASEGMLALARRRAPEADLRVGDIARLPYDDDAFDVVTAFNAVQFADDIPAAIAELARVGRTVAICNWGGKRDLAVMFNAVSVPSPRRDALPRLSDPGVLEELMRAAGLAPQATADVPTPYEVPDLATLVVALRDGSGFELATEDRVREAAAPYRRADGSYRFENRFRYVVATRS
ncbi:class I SAM-dependent methyltransferase [Candidatus Solirubrobacter pratensis]|uniref:class I SAM-dependent methyltransferase n=1 Tax=Candidatus Solirubrobacter pratensis TaxID=1298857 RepID=UPI00041120DA|nr:class I SAM-dependent methyltransferase [Candidatus Solirubrobacter pratensis]